MISVIMAAYNAEDFIALAIESILDQTYREFELIIIDDGSTDNTLEIIKLYLEKDNRVQIIQSDHLGVSLARNLGVNAAKYQWIAIMDADDVSLPERFEQQINATRTNPKVVVWGTYAHHINAMGEVLTLARQGVVNEEDFYHLWNSGHVPFVINPTALFKKEIFLKVGGYSIDFPVSQDFELCERMGHYGPIIAIPKPLLLYRVHARSASMSKFFQQKLLARYVVERHRVQLEGNEASDLKQFIAQYDKKPILARLKRGTVTLGQFWYRKAGLFFAEKHYVQAACYLLLAIASNPAYSIPRVWKQKLSPKTLQSL